MEGKMSETKNTRQWKWGCKYIHFSVPKENDATWRWATKDFFGNKQAIEINKEIG